MLKFANKLAKLANADRVSIPANSEIESDIATKNHHQLRWLFQLIRNNRNEG